MKELDLTYKKYMDLVMEGIIDDELYGEWINHEIWNWLPVAKHQYNQDYIIIHVNKGQKRKVTFQEWFGDEEQ